MRWSASSQALDQPVGKLREQGKKAGGNAHINIHPAHIPDHFLMKIESVSAEGLLTRDTGDDLACPDHKQSRWARRKHPHAAPLS